MTGSGEDAPDAVSQTVFRPSVPVDTGTQPSESEPPDEKPRIPLWAKIGSAVAVIAAAVAIVVVATTGDGEDVDDSVAPPATSAVDNGPEQPPDFEQPDLDTPDGEEAVADRGTGADASGSGSEGSGGAAVVEEESDGSGGEDDVGVVEGSEGSGGAAVVEEESDGSGGEDDVGVVEGSEGSGGAAVVEEESDGPDSEDDVGVVGEEPDSRYRVAFVTKSSDTYSIEYIDFTVEDNVKSEPRQLIVSSEWELGHPSFSPDGSWIAYSRRSGPGKPPWEIFIRNIDTEEELQIVCKDNEHTIEVEGEDGKPDTIGVPTNGSSPSWSRDGKLIVFSHGSAGNDIWTVNVETGEYDPLKRYSETDDAFSSLSPDGSQVVFARADYPVGPNSRRGLFVLNHEETTIPKPLKKDSNVDYRTPDWAPDGRTIAYSFGSPDYTFGLLELLFRHIGVTDREGNSPVSLTRGEVVDTDPSWSTDGRLIAFARSEVDDGEEQNGDIYVLEAGRDDQPHQVFVDPQIDSGDPSLILISASGTDVAVSPTLGCGTS